MGTKTYFLILLLILAAKTGAQDLQLYEMYEPGGDTANSTAFVSLSDNYPLYDYDSLAMPDVSWLTYGEANYIKLGKPYRQHFLKTVKISEEDKLFIYDYANEVLATVPVKEAATVAWLNDYVFGDGPFSQSDYRIGFEITKNQLKGIEPSPYVLVYVGKESPFISRRLKRMDWQQIKPSEMPDVEMSAQNKAKVQEYLEGKYTFGNAYRSEAHGYVFFIQNYAYEEESAFGRRLIALDAKTQKPVLEQFYHTSEGSMPAELGEQWTGYLFKNKPPVLFGLEWLSFSCPEIYFLSPEHEPLYINCDNRH